MLYHTILRQIINNYGVFFHNRAGQQRPVKLSRKSTFVTKLILLSSVRSPVWITAEFAKRSDQITEGDFLRARRRKKTACLWPEKDSKPINYVYSNTQFASLPSPEMEMEEEPFCRFLHKEL